MRTSILVLPAVAGLSLLALAGCSTPTTPNIANAASATAAASASVADSGAAAPVSGTDPCSLVPTAELTAAIGADPGTGVVTNDNGLSQCTWTIADGFTVLAQYTDDADTYLPDAVWPRPDGASDVAGATRGWASVDQFTILAVKDDRGILLNDFSFGATPGPQQSWTDLGDAIAAKL